MNPTDSQTKRILKYLLSGKSITALEAFKKFNCLRLGARIFNIKSLGLYRIKSELIEVKGHKRVSKYSIEI